MRKIILIIIATLWIGCNGEHMTEREKTFASLNEVPASAWKIHDLLIHPC